jgi:ABC-type microcin C transport system permease subunit YejB
MLLFSFCIILIVLFQIGEHHNYYLLIKITSSNHISF